MSAFVVIEGAHSSLQAQDPGLGKQTTEGRILGLQNWDCLVLISGPTPTGGLVLCEALASEL